MKKILLSFAFLGTLALPTLAQTPPPSPAPTATPVPVPAPATTTAPAPVAAPAPAAAPSSDEGGVRLGLTFSPNTAWLHPDSKDIDGDGSKVGYTFGVVAEFPFGPRKAYALRTGLAMTTIGGKFKADYTNTDGSKVSTSQDLTLKYLQVPLLLRLGTKTGGMMDFYGLIGANVGFNVRARADYSTTTTIGSSSTTAGDDNIDMMDNVKLLNVGLLVGLGGELHLGDGPSIFGGINYNKGLTNVPDKDAKFTVNPDKKTKLLADYIELSLGMFF